MQAVTYKIKDWALHFETAESKRIKALQWVPFPNKHDGKGYRRLCAHKKAVEIFAAWNLIVQIASRTPIRGTLADEDGPLTPADMAMKTGFPETIFELALSVLSDASLRICWIEVENSAGHAQQCPAAPSNAQPRPAGIVEGKDREGQGIEGQDREGKEKNWIADAKSILAHLNEKAGRSFEVNEKTTKKILAALHQAGGDVEGIKLMVTRWCEMWKGTRMEEYLRPATLFGPEKFMERYNDRNRPIFKEGSGTKERRTYENPESAMEMKLL